MVTPEIAERMCNKLVEAFINACKPRDMDDVLGLTLKLISMAGLSLAATHGKEEAVALLHSVAEHVGENAHRSHAEIIQRH